MNWTGERECVWIPLILVNLGYRVENIDSSRSEGGRVTHRRLTELEASTFQKG